MRNFMVFLLAVGLGITVAFPVMAHDGWTQTNTPIIEPGEVSYVELLFGNHSNDHASYRIDGTWNPDDTDVIITTPDDRTVNISETLFYTGELSEVDDDVRGINNYYVASFSATEPGIYIVSAQRDSVFSHGDTSSRTLRSAKSFVAVSELPLVQVVREFEGYDKQVTPDRAEFIPLFNPVSVTPYEEVSVQLLLRGEPLADTDVSVISRSMSAAEHITTDADGKITFVTGAADYYLIRAMPATSEGIEGDYDSLQFEATMTFTVQNGSGLKIDQLAGIIEGEGSSTAETDAEDSSGSGEAQSLFENVFFYVSLLLGVGLVLSWIIFLRK